MSSDQIVAIVDAYSTARYFAPLFNARGFTCVHVQSTPVIPAVYAPSYRPDEFVANIVHGTDDLDVTASAVAAHRPVAVLAGIESGVELADQLSERLGLRTNGTKLSPARRDKYRMVETVRAAGVRGAEQIHAADLPSLLDWYAATGAGRVVVKPIRSAGNDGVYFCDDADQVRAAFAALLGTDNALRQHNAEVLAQEYLRGTEYYVNTVSLDGLHYVCDIHETWHLNINGVRDLLGGSHLLSRRGPVQDALVEYTFSVLDALGVRNGPAHTELKMTPTGPCLVETGARICGADLPVLTGAAIGESQLEWTVDAYTNPGRFLDRCGDDYRIGRHAICVNMVSPRAGTLVDYPRMPELRALESFHDVLMRAQPGGQIFQTVNDFTYPMLVHLLNEVDGAVIRDYMTARYLDGEGFYDVR